MSEANAESPLGGGLRGALEQFGASMLGLIRTRLELASLEFAEERERTMRRVILLVVAALFCASAAVAASGLVVLYFWETNRVAALAAVALWYLAIGVGAILKLRASFRSAPSPFTQTVAEFKRDGEWISGVTRGRGRPGTDPR